jgi:uncharacterized protein
MEQLIRWVVKHNRAVVLMVVLITLLLGWQLQGLKINSDILSSLPEDDPLAGLYLEIGEEFDGNDMGMVVLEVDDVFTVESMDAIHRLTDTIRFAEGVLSVTSLTNVLDIKSSEWGIEVGNLVDEYALPDTQEAMDTLRHYVMSKQMYRGALVSEDGQATVIMFTLQHGIDHQKVAHNIRARVHDLGLPGKISMGGLPIMMDDVNRLIIQDVVRLVPLVFLLICLILYLSFRTWRGTILPLLTAGIAVVWTMGFMALTGTSLTIISNIIPVVLVAVGSAYTIHVINSVALFARIGDREALIRAVKYIAIPVVLASLTTVIGFVSFIFGAYLTMIRDFGLFTALGTLIALILSLTLVPALLSFQKAKVTSDGTADGAQPIRKNPEYDLHSLPSKEKSTRLIALVKWMLRRPTTVISVWAVVLLICIAGITMIRTSVNMTHYFKPGFPTRVAEDILQQKFGGSMPVFMLFEGDMQDPEVLKRMAAAELFMKQDPNISTTQSVAGLIEQMNEAMEAGYKVPDDRAQIEQLWFLLDGQEMMDQLVNKELTRGIIQTRFASIDSRDMAVFSEGMTEFIENQNSEVCKVSFTGMPSVYIALNDSLIRSQVSSLLIAIVMVLLMVSLMLKSFRYGVLATIPVVSTVVLLLGFMGLVGISLDVATVLVASVALGIGIDYSIHVITGYRHHLALTGDCHAAILRTLLTSGKAVVINMVSVSAGFLLLLFSQIVPLQNFGLLVAVSMIASGFGALTLLPVLLSLKVESRK